MNPASRDKLLRVGAKPVAAALAQHGIGDCLAATLPARDPFAGEARLTVETCRAGSVLVVDRPMTRLPERLMQRLAGIVLRRELGTLPIEAGDTILRDRNAIVVIPAALVDQIAEEADEVVAFEEFTAEQVSQGGGVYGLHIPTGERARIAFAAWRKLRGR